MFWISVVVVTNLQYFNLFSELKDTEKSKKSTFDVTSPGDDNTNVEDEKRSAEESKSFIKLLDWSY